MHLYHGIACIGNKETNGSNCAVADLLPRNRFEEIFRYSHLADNAKLTPGDKLANMLRF